MTLKFTLKDQLTDTEISLAGLYFTVYDLGMIFLFFFVTTKLVHKSCKFSLMDLVFVVLLVQEEILFLTLR